MPGGGGGFSLTNGIRGCSKVLRCIFRKFWYIDGWVIVRYPMRRICKIRCILENLAKKAPNLPQIGCFLQKNGIEIMRWVTKSRFSRYRYDRILNSTLSIPVRIFWRTPPPPGTICERMRFLEETSSNQSGSKITCTLWQYWFFAHS